MGKIVSFVGFNGGTGRTTTVLSVAAQLGAMGYDVLAIDFSLNAGFDRLDISVKHTLDDILLYNDWSSGHIIKSKNKNVYYLMSTIGLNDVWESIREARYAPSFSINDYLLTHLLMERKSEYDYILIDGPSVAGTAMRNVIVASDHIATLMNEAVPRSKFEQIKDYVDQVRRKAHRTDPWRGFMGAFDISQLPLTRESWEERLGDRDSFTYKLTCEIIERIEEMEDLQYQE